MSQTKSFRGVSRVLAKLEESIQLGNFYEAHQKYRTLYFRYLSQQRYDDCLQLLFNGSLKLLENEQFSSGADLGLLVVETLEKTTVTDTDLWIHRMGLILSKIPANLVERETLLVNSYNFNMFPYQCHLHAISPTTRVLVEKSWNAFGIETIDLHHFGDIHRFLCSTF